MSDMLHQLVVEIGNAQPARNIRCPISAVKRAPASAFLRDHISQNSRNEAPLSFVTFFARVNSPRFTNLLLGGVPMYKALTTLLLTLILFASTPATIPPQRFPTRPIKVEVINPLALVWLNTNSGIYHCPRTRWWGRTKEGAFMSEARALMRGHRPAYGSLCGDRRR